jgi:3-dehydroquinate synthase
MPTAKIRVSLPHEGADRSYHVVIRDGILKELGSGRLPLPDGDSYYIVTDSTVARLYGRKLFSELSRTHSKAGIITFPAGEASKKIETASAVASKLDRLGADRASVILALGGGVVGDLAGFVASIYKRGIRYIQLPTTLLAQVDSSVGGKTGVDTRWGKNQLGTFHQPVGVLTDPLTLGTLPPAGIMNGLTEIVKCAIIADRDMLSDLRNLSEFDSDTLRKFIVDAVRIKAEVVSKDERESNLRSILNFGHTVGHAIESSSNYKLSHGNCVLLGMMAESWIAYRLGILQRDDFGKISEFLSSLSRHLVVAPTILNGRTLVRFARADKKSVSSSLVMSLPEEIGKMHTTRDGSYKILVPVEIFSGSISHLREVLRSRPQ